MLHLCDVNVLLSLVHEGQQFHEAARQWEARVTKRGEIGFSRATQVALLRLLNNPAVMGADLRDGKGAWGALDQLLLDERFVLVVEPPNFEEHFRDLTLRIKHSHQLWPDAYLAALAIATGRIMVTFDPGFRNYKGLNVEVLGR